MIKFKSGGVFLIDFYKMCPIYHKTFGSPFQLYPYPLLILHANVKEEIDQVTYLKKLLDPIRDQYDYIFIDMPPTISDFSNNAMMTADYVLIILQTQELSLEGAETYIKYLQFMADMLIFRLLVCCPCERYREYPEAFKAFKSIGCDECYE